MDALAKLRRGGEQRVVVEHVHIHAGRRAIVGAVTHTGVPGALIENQGQRHARTTSALCQAMKKRTGALTRAYLRRIRCLRPNVLDLDGRVISAKTFSPTL